MKELERFEYCRNDVIPYIRDVLREYYVKEMQGFSDDEFLQVISTHKSHNAFMVPFRKPVKSIVCIFWEVLRDDSERMQCIINAIGEYFDEDGDMGKRLGPFECYHSDVSPYISIVLDRLLPEKRQVAQADLDNGALQIISSHMNKGNPYFTVKFSKPLKSIIYIDWEKLKEETEDVKIYGIAHEMGHYFTGLSGSGLWEKEANNWLKRWGNFDELIEKIHDTHPIDEKEGYAEGYSYANTLSKDALLDVFSHYLVLWNKKELPRRERDVMEERLKYKVLNLGILKKDYSPSYLKGFAFGIMKRVREIAGT